MARQAALFVNLGSPASYKVADVRSYLREFLSDARVLDTHPLIRWLVLNLFILPFRPSRSAAAYRKVWTPEGSPLVVMTRRQRDLVRKTLDDFPIEVAMRYGQPSIDTAIARLKQQDVESLYVLPLYPHYAMSSYETVVAKATESIARQMPHLRVSFLQPFYQDPGYIAALVESAEPYLTKDYDRLLFSFHGLPERHLRRADPSKAHCLHISDCCHTASPVHATCYRHQCFKTVEAFVARAGISQGTYSVSFQSRLGREPWLRPYTDEEFIRLAQTGVKKLRVLCPAFVSDCLETLEEISIEGRKVFLEAGGESFQLIPCLNDHPAWITFLREKIAAWRRNLT